MVGTVFSCNTENANSSLRTLSVLELPPKMEVKGILEDLNHRLEIIHYPNYPHYYFHDDQLTIYIEGKIYNKSPNMLKSELSFMLKSCFSDKRETRELIRDWTETADGEFLIFGYDNESKQVILFNDLLGRLSSYYVIDNKQLVLSRWLKYLFVSTEDNEVCKQGLSQFLLFGHGVGDHTIFSKIKRLRPAQYVHIDYSNKSIEIKNYSESNHSEHNILGGSYKNHVSTLTDLFMDGCKNRIFDERTNVLSLSGGLDSRLVAAGLFRSGAKFESTTLNDPWKVNSVNGSLEVEVAGEIARLTNSSLHEIDGKLANGEDFIELLRFKDGTNHLGVAYILNYLAEVQNLFGEDITFFTGDGGKILKYQTPSGILNSSNDLFEYLVKILNRFQLDSVSKLLGIDEKEIRDPIINHLESFPEEKYKDKYLHFIFNERDPNWVYDGEDRNRHFFWSVSPFFSLDFYKASIQTPSNYKKRNKIYLDLFDSILPEIGDILFANLQWPLKSYKTKLYLFSKDIYNSFPKTIRTNIRKIFKKERLVEDYNSNETIELLKRILNEKSNFYNDFFNVDEINRYRRFNIVELKMILNLVLTLEHFYDDNAILNQYGQNEFKFN